MTQVKSKETTFHKKFMALSASKKKAIRRKLIFDWNIPHPTIQAYLYGYVKPPLCKQKIIADAMELPITELFNDV